MRKREFSSGRKGGYFSVCAAACDSFSLSLQPELQVDSNLICRNDFLRLDVFIQDQIF